MGRLKIMALAAAALLGLAAGAARAGDAEDAMGVVRQMFAAVDKGDLGAAQGFYAADPDIIDEFAPYYWRGPGALAAWFKDFGVYAQARSITEPSLAFGPSPRIEVSGDKAYVVAPAVFNHKAKGAPVSEQGLVTVSMSKSGGVWKVQAWAWGSR